MKLLEISSIFDPHPAGEDPFIQKSKLTGMIKYYRDILEKQHTVYANRYKHLFAYAYQDAAEKLKTSLKIKVASNYRWRFTTSKSNAGSAMESISILAKDSGIIPKIEAESQKLCDMRKHIRDLEKQHKDFDVKAKEIMTAQIAGTITAPPVIDPSKVPKTLSTGGNGKINNPYFKWKGRYAGHPAQCPGWTKQSKDLYLSLSELLDRYGIPGFTMMYASYEKGALEFVVYGANNRLVWRKKGTGASGQNHVYVDGVEFNTTKLMGTYGLGSNITPQAILAPLLADPPAPTV